MNISAWSIRKPIPSILLFILLTFGGLLAFDRLQVQDLPDMDVPMIRVTASLEGAAPAQLETEVARKIEDSIASLSLLEHVTTTVTDGTVLISASFKLEKPSEEALDEVRSAIDAIAADLPARMTSPSVTKVTVQSAPLLAFAVRSTQLDEMELSWFVDNEMTKALRSSPGVGVVNRVGGIDREVRVDLDPRTMAALGVTASDISSRLRAIQHDSSSGKGDVGSIRQSVHTLGAVTSVNELGAVAIPLSSGQSVRLDEIATITDGFSGRASFAYLDGEPVIGVEIIRATGFSDIDVTEDVRAAMKAFAAANPHVEIREAYSTIGPTIENYDGSMHMLLEGALLAVVVVWIFLRDWRATVVSAVALPLSIIPTFLIMEMLDLSLNKVALLALSLVVGILVDDALVEVENIARHLRSGVPPREAALEAADEIGLAVIATTFTLVAVFLPTAFIAGIPGLIFRQFGITAAVAVLVSLLVARLLTPMMAAHMLKRDNRVEREGRVSRAYLAAVKTCLHYRKTTLCGVFAFFALSIGLVPLLSTSYLPPADMSQVQVTLNLQPGSPIEETDRAARRATEILKSVPDIIRVFTSVGTAATGDGPGSATVADHSVARLMVDLTPIAERERSQTEIEDDIRKALAALPGAKVKVGAGATGTVLDLTLTSDNSDLLSEASDALEQELRTIRGIGAVTSSAAMQAPEIRIVPDLARAAALGITAEDISEAVRIATGGAYSAIMPKLNLPERQISIRVQLDPRSRASLDEVAQLRLNGRNGSVELGSIADIRIAGAPSRIDRIDRSRNTTLSIELNGRSLGEVFEEVQALPAFKNLPEGVRFIAQGELERSSDLFSSFALAMAIGIFCVYAVLVLLFHDFLQPLTILMVMPLSIGGALLPLVITGTPFSMPAVIGLLMLMGIATKNSILLVDYAIVARQSGISRFDAVVDACKKRARPIVMTTIAMGFGMLPAALSLTGGDSSFRQPMAIVVIGGLLTSTFLSLLVIPIVYTFIDDFLQFLRQLFEGHKSQEVAPSVHVKSERLSLGAKS
jgi:Cation/multidrug efflux pump